MIVSISLWGPIWSGGKIIIYCDNDACCDVVNNCRPKDPIMMQLLREFTYHVCIYKFYPVVTKISSGDNLIADYISRNHKEEEISVFFETNGIGKKSCIEAPNHLFRYAVNW